MKTYVGTMLFIAACGLLSVQMLFALSFGAEEHASPTVADTQQITQQQSSEALTAGAEQALDLGPPEQWWNDARIVRRLKLSPEQRLKLQDAFDANKGLISERYDSLLQEKARLQKLSDAKDTDEKLLFEEIDRVVESRALLEKANTHMLILLRQQLEVGQVKKLEAAR